MEVAAVIEVLLVEDRLGVTGSGTESGIILVQVDGVDESPLTSTVTERSVYGTVVVILNGVASRCDSGGGLVVAVAASDDDV